MLEALFAILVAALAGPLAVRAFDARAGFVLAVAPLAAFVWFALQIPLVAQGDVRIESLAWVPALDMGLTLRLDGLSLLFALLVTGIGALIVVYASAYLSDHHHLGRFYAYLLGFMAAMLGLVLADDLIALFVFWELTSVTSFLLIGFVHTEPHARRAALQALLITGSGGLALLAGLILLGIAGDAWRFSALSAEVIESHALYPAILVLVLLGCFTKSAQLPFHLWLPNAMAAPTPVSAYLHSATMVKAGVYLLARLNPVLGGSAGWGTLLIGVGAATALVGAVLAIRQTDLKRVLAYTTVTVLGQLTMLIGTNTSYGLQAFVIYLLAHSMYKGALFMAVGSVDHAAGTRELARLGGLIRVMPLTGAAVALAAFSNAGLPPFFGFIAKEFKYAGLIAMGPAGWVTTVVMIVTNALLLVAAGMVFVEAFLGRRGPWPREAHEVSLPMWLGPMVLAVFGFILGAFSGWPETWLVNAAVQSVARGSVDVNLYLWGGVTPAVVASLLTVSLGVAAYHFRHAVRRRLDDFQPLWLVSGDLLWDRLLKRIFRFASGLASGFQHGSLRLHLTLLLLASAGAVLAGMIAIGGGLWTGLAMGEVSAGGLAGCIIAVAGACGAAVMRDRIALVAALGASGLGVALFFLAVNAPDVAITQVMVETLTVLFLALVLRRLPPLTGVGARAPGVRRIHAAVAALFGAVVAGVLAAAVSQPLPGDVAQWYLDNSVPGGHGSNVVNVILVDFRALDTLGEIVVVALAALGVGTLLGRGGAAGQGAALDGLRSLFLRQGLRPLAGLMILMSVVLLWRGHNLPGGGFIGALVGALGFALLALGFGVPRASGLLRLAPAVFIALGIGTALAAGVPGLLAGGAFLTGMWIPGLPLGTPLLFDVGVFLTVLGAVLHMLFRLLGEEA